MVGDIVERLNRKTNNREMNPRFSIIVPLYNKAPYVKKALDSIVPQSLKDWECIIVDDGSTDNSADIAQSIISSLSETDHFIICILRQPNSGVAAARNSGVKESRGEYVCFLDADDWWEANYLEEIDELIQEYPDAGIYCSNYIYYKPGKTHIALNLERGYMNYPEAYSLLTSRAEIQPEADASSLLVSSRLRMNLYSATSRNERWSGCSGPAYYQRR